MRIKIYPYKSGSASARVLAQSLNTKRLKHAGSRFVARRTDVIINWGANALPNFNGARVLNKPAACNLATDKLACLMALNNHDSINIPEYTTDIAVARQWLSNGSTVVCRTLTRGNSGRGIVMASDESELVQAPLYTKYIPKQEEYRVHVAFGNVIDQQRKLRSREVPDEQVNWQVRNHTNGFVFGREGVSLPVHVFASAIEAVNVLGLDFGAVDIIYNAHRDTYYVLEVNTAVGLTGTTLENYTQAFTNYLGGNNQ